ncbi:MAG: Mur ligase family protein [Candidatus Taylorbacteria bacterium]
MDKLPKHIHIVGICGVATSALAIAFHERGVKVTGSDKGFYPPVSTYLQDFGIQYHAGWHPEKIAEYGKPDIIIAGGSGTSLSNPEIIYAKEQNIPLISFAEALGKYIVKENSIVTAGTWGKTTSSSIISYILIQAGMKPSYFTGGLSLSHPTGAISDSKWSVVEGDEYQVAIYDKRPKFVFYKPTHLMLTSVSWDHADLYPTEKEYFQAFEKLVTEVPKSGLLVVCDDDAGVHKVTNKAKSRIVTYGKTTRATYFYHDIKSTKTGLEFKITSKAGTFRLFTPMLGRFNAENITGCFAMATEIGVPPQKTIDAIADFQGIKRRLEKRLDGESINGRIKGVTVFDCHAPTPEKAAALLETLREVYDKKIIAIYEPNIGGRRRETSTQYNGAFERADMVIIPKLTKLKVAEDAADAEKNTNLPLEGDELTKIIDKTHPDTKYIDDDEKVVTYAVTQAKHGDIIVFLGSHGFRGMIEEVVKRLS